VVYRQLQDKIDLAWSQKFPGQPLPSAGPLEIDRTAPPLDITTNIPVEAPALQPGPELPINSPVDIPALPGTVELPANPVPAVPNYPLPPVAQPGPPLVVNPGPPAISNPVPVIIPNAPPPPIGAPQAPPVATPLPPAVVNPVPVEPWQVLFPGAVPATSTTALPPGSILPNLPQGVPSAIIQVPAVPPPSITVEWFRVGQVLRAVPRVAQATAGVVSELAYLFK
jgi:hypothetical protein